MLEHTENSQEDVSDQKGAVPLFAFLFFMVNIFSGALMVSFAFPGYGPLITGFAVIAGFLVAKGVIAYMPDDPKFFTLVSGSALAHIAGMLFLSLSVCDSFLLYSNTCFSAIEAMQKIK